MASKLKKTKRQRAKKTSKGVHGGGGKVTLDAVQKVLLNGGMYVNVKKRWAENA